jgi:hypothetical protein
VTYYWPQDYHWLKFIRRRDPRVHAYPGNLDDRLREDVTPAAKPSIRGCQRIDFELTIDYFGNGRLCCSDWRNELQFGNIQVDPFPEIALRWNAIRAPLRDWTKNWDDVPRVCKLCVVRTPSLAMVNKESYGL